LDASYDISYRRIGSKTEKPYSGCTVNVGSGGLYIETGSCQLKRGELLKVELAVPPTPGLLEFGGKLAGFARVLRGDRICDGAGSKDSRSRKHGAALQFCRPPRLCL
jgi:hypothetical protein